MDFLFISLVTAHTSKHGKPPQNLKEQHTDELKVRKGATFWVERNTMAIWRNAARYCWFKVNLFIPELYTNAWFLLHARLFHAEGDLGVLIAEQYVCYTC